MFFLTRLYKDRAQTVAVRLSFLSFFIFVLYIFVLKIGINAGYILAYYNRVLFPIDVDVSVEYAPHLLLRVVGPT
jgi:hypothetical protein